MAGLCEGGNENAGSLKAICKYRLLSTSSTLSGWLFNDAVSTTRLFSVDEIGDSEIVFDEMRPRIRHRLPGIQLTVGDKPRKKSNQVISPSGDRARVRAQLQTGRQAP
ncbi:hypothetical protein ANN_09362 [Periplaneta americana]|uniref:Uncharacterized protein n=1 Tax=Periplaneta americana TaxID=6978 RepID=A0ABQ8TL53_PERAM|nr:hypothetical protein ANN_09362 [Periplaneta americana]